MNYQETLDKINSRLIFGMQPGLERITKLLELMGNPQDKLRFIHVAGTNGKGSTCAMLSYILSQAGYKTGLFTSPYVKDFRERMQINNEMILPESLQKITDYVYDYVEYMDTQYETITEFEFITAMAFKWFADNNCDIVVLETGLGGRYDATNVIKSPLMSIITSISLDHIKILGDTLGKIAFEKAGIIKSNCDTILYYPQDKEVISVIDNKCKEQNSRLFIPSMEEVTILKNNINGIHFVYRENEYKLSLLGNYQVNNLLVCLKAVDLLKEKGFKINDFDLKSGLSKVKIPARIEIINKSPLIIIDGAHNKGSADSLYDFLVNQLPGKDITLILGMLKDKDVKYFVKKILPLVNRVITTTPSNPRALEGIELKKICSRYCDKVINIEDKSISIDKLIEECKKNSTGVIAGSLYLCSELRNIILEKLK